MDTINTTKLLESILDDIPNLESLAIVNESDIQWIFQNNSQISDQDLKTIFQSTFALFSKNIDYGFQTFYSFQNEKSLFMIDFVSPLHLTNSAFFIQVPISNKHSSIYHYYLSSVLINCESLIILNNT